VQFPVVIENSKGNYFQDTDGNMFLDVFGNIGSTGMGYNHPKMLEACATPEFARIASNRTALGINPPSDYPDLLQKAFIDVAPPGFEHMIFAMCGSCSVELAFKHAMIGLAQKKRGGMDVPPT